MGLLEGYFVPLYNFYLTPESFEQKVSVMLLIRSAAWTTLYHKNGIFSGERKFNI